MGDIPNTIFFKVNVNILSDFIIVDTVFKEPKKKGVSTNKKIIHARSMNSNQGYYIPWVPVHQFYQHHCAESIWLNREPHCHTGVQKYWWFPKQ